MFPNEVPQGEPIPITPPTKTREYTKRRRNAIQSLLMFATDWDDKQDPTGWWLSEKYDGLRAFWNGSKMFSRTGREIKLPDFFRIRLPPLPLDGELWYFFI